MLVTVLFTQVIIPKENMHAYLIYCIGKGENIAKIVFPIKALGSVGPNLSLYNSVAYQAGALSKIMLAALIENTLALD